MKYRKMKNSGDELSVLGFGCMRFPVDKNNKIARAEAEKMLLYAIENGVNYIDTAYPYHGGESELFVGELLKKHNLRDKIKLATKLPSWLIHSKEDMYKYFDEQCKKLQTNYFDYYLIHALNKKYWENYLENDLFGFIEDMLKSGKVKNIGFSFHDDLRTFKKIVDAYDWSFCQIQYNYLDDKYQAGEEGYSYAIDKGLDVIIMEPLRGGKLVNDIPPKVMDIWDKAECKRSPVQWALQWLWDKPGVKVVLSGMSDFSQVEENLKYADESAVDLLTESELAIINEVKTFYKERMQVNCTTCGYCMPCPVGVNIPACFAHYNNAYIFDDIEGSKRMYNMFLGNIQKASACAECGRCETLCPQNIEIMEHLKKIKEIFE